MFTADQRRRALLPAALFLILAVAAAVRVWHLAAGVPFALSIDEPQVFDRVLRIMRTGDWNTHLFDYPSLVIYVHTLVAVGRFLIGAVRGEWRSLAGFSIPDALVTGRLVAAAIGVITVWLTYRVGRELEAPRAGLLAAAQLAVWPTHVRESHFILTDVPATALTTATVLLAVRAVRRRSAASYAWAGLAAGLAGAAKYNGGIAAVAVAAAWWVDARRAPDRWKLAGIALVALLAGVVAGSPFIVLDFRAFLDGFAAQAARFSGPSRPGDPVWLVYVKHLSLAGWLWLPLAACGMALVIVRRETRSRWMPVVAFTVVYFYVLATHAIVFGRYALPLGPMIALLASICALDALTRLQRVRSLQQPGARAAALAAVVLLLTASFSVETVRWLKAFARADTRSMAADWLRANAPPGSGLAVENSGPTYLGVAGYQVLGTELLLEHPAGWYRGRADYLILSSPDLDRYSDYLAMGPTLFQVEPNPQRWGPPIRIVRIGSQR